MRKSLYRRHNQVFLGLLRRYREQGKFRQRDLAQHLGAVQGTVSKAETGNRRLDVIELREWLLAMGVDFLEFMTELHEQLEALTHLDPWLFSPAAQAEHQAGRDVPPEPERRLDSHVNALAELLAPVMRAGLIREVTDTLAELDSVEIRGRPLSRWFGSLTSHQAGAAASLLQPADAEVLSNSQELAQLLLSNWLGLMTHAGRVRTTQLIDALRSNPLLLPPEVTTGCLAYPVPEEQVRTILAAFLQAHWTPDLIAQWQARWGEEN
jgi:transcriptional regulator with XRE-family HTH domain